VIVTFYSFKGGVGRSMALANVAEFLADMGYRVIASDWDLEAPGLERFFWPHDHREQRYKQDQDPLLEKPGLIELLIEYKEILSDPADATETSTEAADDFAMVGTLRLRRPSSRLVAVSKQITRPGSLRLLTAGQRTGELLEQYAESVRRFDWQEFYDRWAGDSYIEFFRRDLVGDPKQDVRGAGDILLIDSRTGVTEHGGVGTHHLADAVVVMTAANDLNMDGSKWMVDALRNPQLTELRGGRALRVIPVATRIERDAQRDELLDFRRRFLAAFKDALNDSVGDADTFALASEIKYMPFYSFYERVVAREPEEDREPDLAAAYRAIAEGIVRCGVASGLLREPTSQGIVARAPASAPPLAQAPSWDHERFLLDLSDAADALDKTAASDLIDELEEHMRNTDEVYPDDQSVKILRHLRRKRYFDLAQRAAEKLIEYGQNASRVRVLYAESLIEQGNLAAARSTVQALITETKADTHENTEARGLLAAVFERHYLDAPDPSSSRSRQNLERAINTYYEIYQSSPNAFTWQHGIKTVALVQRARRDGIELESAPDANALAQAILKECETHSFRTDWMIAIAIEASLALNEHAPALKWLQQYLAVPDNDAYQLSSLHRELTDVWQLDLASEPGTSLLPPLRAAILQRGGQLDLEMSAATRTPEKPSARLQTILGDEGVRAVEWYAVGLERCEAVVRIDSRSGGAVSTGFLLPGVSLHPSLGKDLMLVTCAYVISDDPASRYSLRPYEAAGVLEKRSETVGLKEIVISSPQLDTTIIRLDRRISGIPNYPIAQNVSTRHVFLAGYAGAQMSLSANLYLDYDDPLIHYRGHTAPGSSGSPIFDDHWQLLGIHHAGNANMRRLHGQSGTYAANEGISIAAILRWLNAVLGPPRSKTTSRKKPVKRSRTKTRARS
jgi:hypothetical protein